MLKFCLAFLLLFNQQLLNTGSQINDLEFLFLKYSNSSKIKINANRFLNNFLNNLKINSNLATRYECFESKLANRLVLNETKNIGLNEFSRLSSFMLASWDKCLDPKFKLNISFNQNNNNTNTILNTLCINIDKIPREGKIFF